MHKLAAVLLMGLAYAVTPAPALSATPEGCWRPGSLWDANCGEADYVIVPILLLPADHPEPKAGYVELIDQQLRWGQRWYASQLGGHSYNYSKVRVVRVPELSSQTMMSCTLDCVETHYYSVIDALKKRGFPIGSARTLRRHYIVFVQGINRFGGGSSGEIFEGPEWWGDHNMAMLYSHYLDRGLMGRSPDLLKVSGVGFTESIEPWYHSLGVLVHEFGHAFGLHHCYVGGESSFMASGLAPNANIIETTNCPQKTVLRNNPFLGFATETGVRFIQRLHLAKGRNDISFLVEPDQKSLATLLAPLRGKVGSVYFYDRRDARYDVNNPINPWRKFTLDSPYAFLNTITNTDGRFGHAYMLYMKEPAVLDVAGTLIRDQVIPVAYGWNMFGYAGEEKPIAEALSTIKGHYDRIYRWDVQAQVWEKYDPNAPAFLNSMRTLKPGFLYQLRVTQANNDALLVFPGKRP